MSPHTPTAKVVIALAAGLIAFGFAPILVRTAPDTSPLVLVTWRTVFALLLLIPFWFWLRSTSNHPAPAHPAGSAESGGGPGTSTLARDRRLIALAGACLGLHFTFWLSSLYYTSVASASVLVTIHPIIMIVVERVWKGRRFPFATWAGVFIAFGGSVMLGISDSRMEQDFADPLFGNMLAFAAALIFVVYLLIGREIRQRREWIDYVFPVYFFAAATCATIALAAGENLTDISTAGIWAGLGLAVGPQIIGHGSMNYAVKYVSPTLLSTLVLAEPFFASFLAFLFFTEIPPVPSIAAMLIILAGVGLSWRKRAQ